MHLNPRNTFDQTLTWFSRTVAVVAIMVGPGLFGAWLDHRWGSSFFTPAGFLLGMALATTALIVIAQKLTPPARGKPLAEDDVDVPSDHADTGDPNPGRDGPGTGLQRGLSDDSVSGGGSGPASKPKGVDG